MPDEGHSHYVIWIDVPGGCRARWAHAVSPQFRRILAMANTDPFSASVIPFEVPEQMRAFAEKGVSQARDNYAKFKDVAETHNGTIEAVFTTASKGASEYSAKLMEMMKANTTATLDLAQALLAVKSPSEAMELWTSHAKKQFEAFTAHSKELAELSQRVATDTVEPIKASASKLFKPAA
jgi:phasin